MSVMDKDFLDLVQHGKMKSGNNYGVGVICYRPQDNTILIAKRTDTKTFCTAGGKVEVGETPIHGALRELREESNVKINSCICYDYAAHTSPNGKNWLDFMFFTTDFDDSNLKNQESEVEPWQYVTVEEALNMDLFPPTRRSIERAIQLGLFNQSNFVQTLENEGNGAQYEKGVITQCEFAPNPFYTDTEGCSYSHCDVGYDAIF